MTKQIKETIVERYLRLKVEELGGMCEKFTSPSRRGVPDRLITLPGLPMFMVECKRPGKIPTATQRRDHARRKKLGQTVYAVSTKDQINQMLAQVTGEL